MNINLDKGSGRGTTGEDRASSGPRARRADRRPEDPEDDRRDDGGRRDGQNPRDEDFPEHGPLDVLAAERRQRDGRHGADLAVRGMSGGRDISIHFGWSRGIVNRRRVF